MIAFSAILFLSCGGDDDTAPKINQAEIELASILKGEFIGSKNNLSDALIECREIIFTPYTTPVIEKYSVNGKYINIDRDLTIYGECDIKQYYIANNDNKEHLMEVSYHWKYSINVAYDGAQPELYLLPENYGRYEVYDITKKSSSSFEMGGISYNRR